LENLAVSTPGASNNTIESITRSEELLKEDPVGLILMITAVSVVGTSLILLYFIFTYLGKLHINVGKKRKEAATSKTEAKTEKTGITVKDKKNEDLMTNEELAAIAIALYKYSEDLHDIEDTVLTINRAAKAYSPWSSKIYGLTQIPIKK
ncbi:MAG: OadG family protein, partial [Massilibacteroides sp.]|nr:OadG family protein [Massilibacteroides sp.]